MGWVHRRRDLGNLLFLDIRDRTGIVQVVFTKRRNRPPTPKRASSRRIRGSRRRPGNQAPKIQSELATGEIELVATNLHILNNAKTPPFPVEDEINAAEETRLRYRYIDLRAPGPIANSRCATRSSSNPQSYGRNGFIEVETPMLTRSTPEGARDYLVPSRVHHGPVLTLSRNRRNLQANPHDWRTRPLLPNREMFSRRRSPRGPPARIHPARPGNVLPRQEDIFEVIENVMVRACAVAGVKASAPSRTCLQRRHPQIRQRQADLRFGMELHEVTSSFLEEAKQKAANRRQRLCIRRHGAANYSRKQLDDLTEKAKSIGARGAYFVKVAPEGTTSTVEKLIGPENVKKLAEAAGAKPGDLVVAVSAKQQIKGTEAAALVAGNSACN